MPKGARHVETGILRPGTWGYSLEIDGGGVWQLDMPRSARRFIGQRVTVEGTRSGFGLLDVRRLRVADAIIPAIKPCSATRLKWSVKSSVKPVQRENVGAAPFVPPLPENAGNAS